MARRSADRRHRARRATRPPTPSAALTCWVSPTTTTSAWRARSGSPASSAKSSATPRVRCRATCWRDYSRAWKRNRQGRQQFPGVGLDGPSVGQSVDVGVDNLDAAIRTTGRPGTAIGLSEGGFVVDGEQARLATAPDAPPPNALNFATFGDPIGHHAFGQSFLRATFPVGSVVPALDYTDAPPYESQYDTNRFVAAYDSIADFPDRPDNMFAFANTLLGLATGHTAVAFTNASMVPPRNIRTTINSRGAKDTTIMVPQKHLPLVMPLKYIGIPEDTLNKLDAILIPRVNAGYIRNDDPATAPVQVDPVHGFDPAEVTAPANQATFGGGADPFSQILSGAMSVLSHGASETPN